MVNIAMITTIIKNKNNFIFRPDLATEKITVEAVASLVYVFFLDQSSGQDLALDFILRGNGANVKIIGFNISDTSKSVLKLNINHQGLRTFSRVWIKSVLAGSAESKIQGLIKVEKAAQGADGYFIHNTLLLSKKARERTSPTLEIEANEVKVSHSATVSNFDPETLFYLNSRGIKNSAAKRLVTASFVKGCLLEIPDEARNKCEALVDKKLDLFL